MAINTNIGPERVEVTLSPTGVVLVPGAPTAITAFIIRSTKDGAPVDTPVVHSSLEAVVEQFGDADDMGNAYYAIRGFYSNSGTGNQVIIVNVSPSASGSQVDDRGVANDAGGGFLEDEGEIVTSLSISAYAPTTGLVTFGASDFSQVQIGDFLKDDNGRLFAITAVDDANDQLTVAAGLNSLASSAIHSSGGLNENSTAAKVLRLYTADEHNGKAVVQEGTSKGAVTITSIVNRQVIASAGGFLDMGAKIGDILVDSGSAVFYITSVIDDDKVEVDRTGAAAGAATVYTALVDIILDTLRSASSNASQTPGIAFASSGLGFGILPTSVTPFPEDSLNGHFMSINGEEKEVLASSIVASGTLDANFAGANTLVYTASSGLVQFAGAEDLSTVAPGDMWRDASNNDFVIDAVNDGADNITIALNQTINTSAGSSVRQGQARVSLVDTAFDPGTTSVPSFLEPANQLDVPATSTLLADDYFIASAEVQDADYLGDAANGKGLHSLDSIDDVNLITIPEVTSRTVQNGLIDYCETDRDDCFSLLTIPQNIRTASTDTVLASVTISTVVNGSINSTVSFSGSPNLSGVSAGDILDFNSVKYLILDVDDDDKKLTVESTSIAGSGAASVSSPSAITYKETVVNNPSKNAAWYFNHVKVLRSSDSAIITVDPIGHVAGVMARIDANVSIGGVSRAPAGLGVSALADTIDLDLSISERKDAGPLRLAFINRIEQKPGEGRNIGSAYVAESQSSPLFTADEQLIQVIRTNLFIKESLEQGLRSFLWKNFSPVTQLQGENAILSFLRNNSYLFPAGVPESDQFRVISVAPTSDDLATGVMKYRVQVSTNRPARFIDIELEFPIPSQSA